jgi:ribonucleoside-diphosphate reductase alpha chain
LNKGPFKTEFAQKIFENKYAQGNDDTWDTLAERLVEDVCGTRNGTTGALLPDEARRALVTAIKKMQFIPGGRYLYYAGRPFKAYNNCYLLRGEHDTREEWASLAERSLSCLASGGGIGIDYSIFRGKGTPLSRTGGTASGPVPLMYAVNEIGRNVMQGGSRRSAIYASLDRQHPDVHDFLRAKNWHDQPIGKQLKADGTPYTHWDAKQEDFNWKAPLDMTNISVNYSDEWLNLSNREGDSIFLENCRQAMMTGEPGFSFNFGDKANETLRNACTEVTSEDDSDVCNLGSVNLGNIHSLDEFQGCCQCFASKFLVCGTLRADLPYEKVYRVREKTDASVLASWGFTNGYSNADKPTR